MFKALVAIAIMAAAVTAVPISSPKFLRIPLTRMTQTARQAAAAKGVELPPPVRMLQDSDEILSDYMDAQYYGPQDPSPSATRPRPSMLYSTRAAATCGSHPRSAVCSTSLARHTRSTTQVPAALTSRTARLSAFAMALVPSLAFCLRMM